MANDKQDGRMNLNPFSNYWKRFAFDMLMLAGGLSFVYICVMTGIVR